MIARWWSRLDRRGRVIAAAGHMLAAAVTAALVIWWDSYAAQYVVQNVLPPSGGTLAGVYIAHLRLHTRLDQQDAKIAANHEDMKQHVTAATGGSDGQDHSDT